MNWSITDASGVICKRAAQSGDAYQKGRASKETLKQRGRGRALREAGWSQCFSSVCLSKLIRWQQTKWPEQSHGCHQLSPRDSLKATCSFLCKIVWLFMHRIVFFSPVIQNTFVSSFCCCLVSSPLPSFLNQTAFISYTGLHMPPAWESEGVLMGSSVSLYEL